MVILLLCNDCWLKQKNRHGFDVNSMTAATVVYEGNQDEVLLKQRKRSLNCYSFCLCWVAAICRNISKVALLRKQVSAIASSYDGVNGGSENGRRGYFLT